MNVYGSTISAMNVGGFYQAGLGLDGLDTVAKPENTWIIGNHYIYKSHTYMGYRVATYQAEFHGMEKKYGVCFEKG